jgi:glycosyltransferase involved in cell wall biosynthesis
MVENLKKEKVAAIVSAFNEEKPIGNVLKALKETKEIDEIIVVSDGSTDKTSQIAKSFGVKIFEEKEREGKGKALKKGVKNTDAKIIAFLDVDLIGPKDYAKIGRELKPLAKKAKEWGVKISYSAYTPLRTGNKKLCIQDEKEKKELREIFKELILLQEKTDFIVNSKNGILRFLKFLETGYIPKRQTDLSFLVVMPVGFFIPCSLRRIKFKNLEDLRKNFSVKNTCGGCYVAIRCYSEESIFDQIKKLPYYWKIIKSKSVSNLF